MESKREYYLSRDIVLMCENFADRVVPTNLDEYGSRNQSSSSKIWNDVFSGKLAEWGVYLIYLERGRKNINPPDMCVYGAGSKSFEADLKYGSFNLHVKSQLFESAYKYGDSWIFETKDPLFESCSEYDIIVGCRVTLDSHSRDYIEGALVEIKIEKPFSQLVIGDPKLSKFSGKKKALYLRDNNG